MTVPSRDLPPILQGATWEVVIRWESDSLVYKPIATITQAAPGLVTCAVSHGLPPDWRAAIVGAKGMRQVNARRDPPALGDFFTARVVDNESIELPYATSSFPAYTSGGSLVYRAPRDLASLSARMQLRNAVEETGTPILSLTSGAGIALDNVDKKITLTIGSDVTATLDFDRVVYDLELYDASPTPIVYRILKGSIPLDREVTK